MAVGTFKAHETEDLVSARGVGCRLSLRTPLSGANDMAWNRDRALERIRAAKQDTSSIEVVDLTREVDLANADMPLNKAYRVDGVHGYIDITNADELLGSTASESERSHKRFVRYLHILSRVVHAAILAGTDVFKIDQQNHRLHLLVYKPYNDEAKRIAVMVTVMDALCTLLGRVDELHAELEDSRVCAGVESGIALAVKNGTRGDRELLFLGNPANHAAKLITAERVGVFLGDHAREVLGEPFSNGKKEVALTPEELNSLARRAGLGLDIEKMLVRWKTELANTPLADVQFVRPSPPLRQLQIASLTPANSRRFDGVAFMADVDGFTAFVGKRIDDRRGEGEAMQALHVIRKELRDVFHELDGRRVRYLGDCVQAATLEGATETDREKTVHASLDIVAALRSSFDLIKTELPAARELGLAIGAELGPLTITRVGMKTNRDRCIAGRALLDAERCQRAGNGEDSVLGEAFRQAGDEVSRKIFETEGATIRMLDVNKLDALRRAASGKLGLSVEPRPAAESPKAFSR